MLDDGKVDQRIVTLYDMRSSVVWRESDLDSDGVYEYRDEYTYDLDGRLLGHTGYVLGVADFRDRNVYDACPTQLRQEKDDDADGILDSVTRFGYDEFGNLTEEALDADPVPLDGVTDFRIRHTVSSDGRREVTRHYVGDDGSVDRVYLYEWMGNLLVQFGSESSYVTYGYSKAGRLVALDWYQSDHADPTNRFSFEYDDGGRLETETEHRWTGSEYRWENSVTYRYDVHGRLIGERHTARGTAPWVTETAYSGCGSGR